MLQPARLTRRLSQVPCKLLLLARVATADVFILLLPDSQCPISHGSQLESLMDA